MIGSSSALIVSSDPESRSILRSILEKEGLHAIQASGSGECLSFCQPRTLAWYSANGVWWTARTAS
jgi:CheY-like chemotaxis protein